MTITIKWWMVSILLVIAPVVFALARKQQGDYDLGLDVFVAFAACWAMALGLTIGKLM